MRKKKPVNLKHSLRLLGKARSIIHEYGTHKSIERLEKVYPEYHRVGSCGENTAATMVTAGPNRFERASPT